MEHMSPTHGKKVCAVPIRKKLSTLNRPQRVVPHGSFANLVFESWNRTGATAAQKQNQPLASG
jgi:hypothetical protein